MNKYQEVPAILKKYADICIFHIEATKPTDLWQDVIDMLKQGQYGSFAVYILNTFQSGILVDYAKRIIATLQELVDIVPEYKKLKDKATPKKPIKKLDDDFDYEFDDSYTHHYCPNCEYEVDESYCPCCGQALDWSEKDD